MDTEELHGLFETPVVVLAAGFSAACIGELTPAEAAFVASAVSVRRLQFATARALAKRALARFGVQDTEILRGHGGEPLWPPGLTGSISHSSRRAVVAVSESARSGCIGIDVEHRQVLARCLWHDVLLPEESGELLKRFDGADRERWALLFFSAKEAFYKAQYGWSRRFLDFHAVRVSLSAKAGDNRGTFSCELAAPLPPFRTSRPGRGHFRWDAWCSGELLTAFQIEPLHVGLQRFLQP